MCTISTIKAKRLLHMGCGVYLAQVVVKSSLKITLDSTSEVQELIWSQVLDLKRNLGIWDGNVKFMSGPEEVFEFLRYSFGTNILELP